MNPKVSICVPNLNTLPFLAERFETIYAQSFQDWELLVYDSFSDDGAWEYIREQEAAEPRMRAWQGPREGTPGSWSPCVREAQGEYVYVATSDDTMPPDFLEKLVSALDAHPECDLAHGRLRAIDEEGRDLARQNEWWAHESLFALSSGDLIDRPHVRKAPHDAVLHLDGRTVYISITQLLIRRSLFDKVGYFESRWGAAGDFAWNMRAAMAANTIHVPDTWGGWRLHASQATDASTARTTEHGEKVDGMIEQAMADCAQFLDPEVRQVVEGIWVPHSRDHRRLKREMDHEESWVRRQALAAKSVLAGSPAGRDHLRSKLLREEPWAVSAPARIKAWLEDLGKGPWLVPVPDHDGPGDADSREG